MMPFYSTFQKTCSYLGYCQLRLQVTCSSWLSVIFLMFILTLNSDDPFTTFLVVPDRRVSIFPLLRFIISSFSWNHASNVLRSLLSFPVMSVAVFPEAYNIVSPAYLIT